MHDLTWYYEHPDYFMITGHRGASYEFPENTLLSMRKAVEAGVDMIEFDLRGTCEDIPVLLHDETIDKTSNGTGLPETHTLAELKKLNFSYWIQDTRRIAPVYEDIQIPTFEEILQEFRDQVCMNIQVYAKTDEMLKNACILYKKYDMYGRGYFTIGSDAIDKVRAIDPDIELCTTRGWDNRSKPETIHLCQESDHCRFLQPVKEFTNEQAYTLIKELGMRSNTFFTDDPEEMKKLQQMGSQGILTNKAHLMCKNRPGTAK